MAFTFTINGHTYTSDTTNTTVPDGYRFIGYGYVTALANLAQDMVVVAGQALGYSSAAEQSALDAAASAASAAAIAGAFVGTSTTAWTPVLGAKTFVTQSGEQYTPGVFLSFVSVATPSAWGVGQVSSYSGTSLEMDIQVINGAGSHSDWNISLIGTPGPQGKGITDDSVGFHLDGGTTSKRLTVTADVTLSEQPAGRTANTFSGAQNFARATVASHATTADIWGAVGNQINWTGTETTTAFPDAPQGGVERTLICAGACSFTAGANMLIDGVTSGNTVTCAANDKIVVRAISTTQFDLTRHKADGTAQVATSSSVGDHEVVVYTGNGHGSTNTKIRRFTTTGTSVGTAITYADSAENGGSFTINADGLYAISYTDTCSSDSAYMGVSVNSSQLTTNIQSITQANRLMMAKTITNAGGESSFGTVARVLKLSSGDVIRAHTFGTTAFSTTTGFTYFAIRKVGT